MKFLNKLNSFYKRELESKPKKRFRIILSLFLINLILFGYFGIYVGINSSSKKADLKQEYKVAIQNMKKNTDTVLLLEPLLQKNAGVEVINTAISDDKDIQDYLESFIKISAEQQFVIEKFDVDSSYNNGEILIRTTTTGTITKIPDFLFAIENLERLTLIEDVTIKSDVDADPFFSKIVINLKIFTL